MRPYFPPAAGATVIPVTTATVDNGSKAHDATRYLTKRVAGRIVTETLTTPPVN